MNAKELCALLITKGLKSLDDDQEEIVVDYLEKMKIRVDLDMKPRKMCELLLDKLMQKELGKTIPISAYANSILGKEAVVAAEKKTFIANESLKNDRNRARRNLESLSLKLPGCITDDKNIFSRNVYDLAIDPELGIMSLDDGTSQYGAVISVSENLYSQIFTKYENPIIEIRTNKGNKAYAKIVAFHQGPNNEIYITPLVALLLEIEGKGAAFLQLCLSLPEISKIKFTFYGTKAELAFNLQNIISKIPSVINAFSYLSLGSILTTEVGNTQIQIRVDGLYDRDQDPIFAGLIPFGDNDIPFEIEADI